MKKWAKNAFTACIDLISLGMALILFGITAGIFVHSLVLLWK